MAKAGLARRRSVRIIRAGGRRAGAIARRGLTAAGRAARDEKHTIAALVTAAALGYVARPGGMELPSIPALGVPLTYGLGLWIAGKYTKNPMLQHAATGAIAIGVYEKVKARSITAGRDDAAGDDPIEGDLDD